MPKNAEAIDTGPSQTMIWERDGKEMVYIPEGEFLMGSDEGQKNEGPPHIAFVNAYYIDRYPVTNREYKRFVDATDHPVPCYEVEWANLREYNWNCDERTPPKGKEDHPVVLVTWEDARAYAAWAGKRLPTEAEWERAARSTEGHRWPWGNQFAEGLCNTKETKINRTTPVGQYSPDGDTVEEVGDMVGNVWEWTSSLFRPYPGLPIPIPRQIADYGPDFFLWIIYPPVLHRGSPGFHKQPVFSF